MITVVVPVYNIKDYIEACITSILNQTLAAFELLLIDDGSTDGSAAICDSFAEKDDRIVVVHKENGGLSDARNWGTQRAKGEWITYIDGDDWVAPEYLEELYTNACDYEAQISVVQIAGQGRKKNASVQTLTGWEGAKRIVYGNDLTMIVAPGKLYHGSLFPVLAYPYGKSNEDEFVTYKAFYNAKRVVVSPKEYYFYVTRPGSIMQSDYGIRRLDKLQALREAVDYFVDKQEKKLAACAKLRYFLNLQISWYRVSHSSAIPMKQEVLKKLKQCRREYWQQEKKEIIRVARCTEKAAILAFSIHPRLYLIMCRLYLKE